MTRLFKSAFIPLTVAIALTFGLTGFTFFNIDSAVETVPAPAKEPVVRLETTPDTKAAAGEKVFKANCKSCHRLGQKLIGPALGNVFSRRDSLWITRWISNSSKMIADEDPIAVGLFLENNKLAMTNFTSMKKEDMDALLAYLKFVDSNPVPVH